MNSANTVYFGFVVTIFANGAAQDLLWALFEGLTPARLFVDTLLIVVCTLCFRWVTVQVGIEKIAQQAKAKKRDTPADEENQSLLAPFRYEVPPPAQPTEEDALLKDGLRLYRESVLYKRAHRQTETTGLPAGDGMGTSWNNRYPPI